MKKATTVEEQIDIFRSRNMRIDDEEKAMEVLNDIGFFRLGLYCAPFLVDTSKMQEKRYKDGTSFKDVVDLYYFDNQLRLILLKYIHRIEINFRTKISNTLSTKYKDSPTWFVDKNIIKKTYIDEFDEKVYTSAFRKKNAVIKKHHRDNINDKYAPAWKTLEFMSFGAIIHLFDAIKDDEDKLLIADGYGIRQEAVLLNYINSVCEVRNICSHGGVLFDLSLPRTVKKGPAGGMTKREAHSIIGALKVVLYLISQISTSRKNDFLSELEDLFKGNDWSPLLRSVLENKMDIANFRKEKFAFLQVIV